MRIRTEVKIGIIVLATIVLVIYGINYLKGKNVLKRTDVYYSVFDDISGLKLSGTIYINGMKVGLINDIRFQKNNYDKIVVALAVDKGIHIPKKSTVELYSSDLMGNKALRIIPSAEQEMARYGDTLASKIQMDLFTSLQAELDPFKQRTESAIASLDSFITAMNNIFDPSIQMNVQQLIRNLNESSVSLSAQLNPGGKLDQTISDLSSFAKTLSDNKEKLNAVFSNLEQITDSVASSNLKNVLVSMNNALNQLDKLITGINAGEGSIGLLTRNDSLYNNLESAAANLSSLLKDLEENPKRYVHFSLFGRKDKSQVK